MKFQIRNIVYMINKWFLKRKILLILKFFSLIILIKRYLDTHKRKLKQLNLKKNEENENETKIISGKKRKKEIKRKEKARSREYYRMLLATMEKKETATYATLV